MKIMATGLRERALLALVSGPPEGAENGRQASGMRVRRPWILANLSIAQRDINSKNSFKKKTS